MINSFSPKNPNEKQSNERGAALVSALLITVLLLGICGALLMTASFTAGNTFDSTSEMQAYYAAETGLQATLDVLRGNVAPRTAGSTTKMSFRNAITPATSNKSGGSTTVAVLSEWLPYDNNTYADRVPLTSGYTPMNGIAYSVVVSNADNSAKPEPDRVLVQVTGYGPKNAVKKMEMVVAKAFLGSFTSPSTVLPIGSTQTPVAQAANISVGTSSASGLTGQDQVSSTTYASIGVTNTTDLVIATAATIGQNVSPAPARLTASQIPYFLQTPDAARDALNDLQGTAELTNRYFTTSAPPPDFGSPALPKLTFVDGDISILESAGTGAGLLVVTGTLTLRGN